MHLGMNTTNDDAYSTSKKFMIFLQISEEL
jgi:hypothetical protein